MGPSMPSLEERLAQIEKDYPINAFSGFSRLVTSIRRMRAERQQQIPVHLRTRFPVSANRQAAVGSVLRGAVWPISARLASTLP
jgi:hypothetical protein